MMDGGFHQRRSNAQECAASFRRTIKKKQKKTEVAVEERKMGGWRWSETVGGRAQQAAGRGNKERCSVGRVPSSGCRGAALVSALDAQLGGGRRAVARRTALATRLHAIPADRWLIAHNELQSSFIAHALPPESRLTRHKA
uniref:Uncharacterized protein n=1 Tax=Plectus sambesii TaxID=2011161 RepID=A0A914WI79_9BILA